MNWIFLYTFLLANGSTIHAEMPAADRDRHRPVRNFEHCERLAHEQRLRMLESFAVSENKMFTNVTIRCERKRNRRRD